MIEDVINVMKRINEIKGRFGRMRHNPAQFVQKNGSGSFGAVLDKTVSAQKTSSIQETGKSDHASTQNLLSELVKNRNSATIAASAIQSGVDSVDDGSEFSLKGSATKDIISKVLESYTKNR